MLKKGALVIMLFLLVALAGCETAKGVGATAYGVGSGLVSTAEGAGKDTYNFWNFLKSVDRWMQENLW
jgi:predicted small secreted protein